MDSSALLLQETEKEAMLFQEDNLSVWTLTIIELQVIIFSFIHNNEICKAPTPWVKALNKHSTHNVRKGGKCLPQFNKS